MLIVMRAGISRANGSLYPPERASAALFLCHLLSPATCFGGNLATCWLLTGLACFSRDRRSCNVHSFPF